MLFIELFVPKGNLGEEQRRHLSERLATEMMSTDGAPADVIERGRAISWLVLHEPEVWAVGGRPVEATDAPRYVVRVTVPGGHLNDAMRAEVVRRITRVLAEIEDDPQRLSREAHAWVHIVELPDGTIGAFGQVVRTADIIDLIVQGRTPEATTPTAVPAATAIDPICGMAVALTDTAITLERDGTTHAFCNTTCRDIFADQAASFAYRR
jgi:YHS domain-containing protein/phenylpyruvate tautomerase PptA (4-oxalocrotonate tautomerase family)